jgi:hypothetical protein
MRVMRETRTTRAQGQGRLGWQGQEGQGKGKGNDHEGDVGGSNDCHGDDMDDDRSGKDVMARTARAARAARATRAWAARASRVARARSRAMNDHKEEIVPQIVP